MTARFVTPQYRLSQQIDEPGGRTVELAVKSAQEGVGALKNAAAAAVDDTLAQVDAAFAALPSDFDLIAMGQLYKRTTGLIGICATAGLMDMDRAAYSLCDLLDRMMANRRIDRQPLAVHLQALHLLRQPAAVVKAGLQVKEVLAGLARVRQMYAPAAPGGAA